MTTPLLTPRFALGALLCLLAVWLIALNWYTFWRAHLRRQPAPSWIPLLGGLLGSAGLALIPSLRAWWWLPFLIDWGSAPGILHAIVIHARGKPGGS